jgi:hypothetical protein
MKDKIIRFLEVYLAFIGFALLVNLSLEILIPTPEEKQMAGIIMFYILFSFLGSLIFLFKNFRPLHMGLLSLIIGFILEFAFMRPDWVQNIYAFNISEKTIGPIVVAIIVSSFYWFIAWGIPSYLIHKYLLKTRAL